MRFITLLFTTVVITTLSFPAFSEWKLDNEFSKLSFVSIKKGQVAEVHSFDKLAGIISSKGAVEFSIDLTSVNTKVAIRDDRMKEFLFQTNMFPKAQFNAEISKDLLNKMAAGESKKLSLTGDIRLHGEVQNIKTEVLIAKLSQTHIVVSSMAPLVLNAHQFSMVEGVSKLQELAQLPSISNAVPVNFVLTFKNQ